MFYTIQNALSNNKKVSIYTSIQPARINILNENDIEDLEEFLYCKEKDVEYIIPKSKITKVEIRK